MGEPEPETCSSQLVESSPAENAIVDIAAPIPITSSNVEDVPLATMLKYARYPVKPPPTQSLLQSSLMQKTAPLPNAGPTRSHSSSAISRGAGLVHSQSSSSIGGRSRRSESLGRNQPKSQNFGPARFRPSSARSQIH